MTKKNKLILILGMLVWVIGDLWTTHIGFSLGILESNPFLSEKTFYEIAVIKIIGAVVLPTSILLLDKMHTSNNKVNKWKLKFVNRYPIGILVYGIFISVANIISISRVM